MYKFRLIFVAAALLLAGCSKQEQPAQQIVQCTFNAGIDFSVNDSSTRGTIAGDAGRVDRCVMEIFYQGQRCKRSEAQVISGHTSFTVDIVAGRTYDVILWACHEGSYDDSSLQAVTLSSGVTSLSSDDIDAFYSRCTSVAIGTNPSPVEMTLKRAMALVNVVSPDECQISVSAPTCWNLLTDTLSSAKTFSWSYDSPFYVFAPSEDISIELTIDGKSYDNIPLKRNYKTNVIINQ